MPLRNPHRKRQFKLPPIWLHSVIAVTLHRNREKHGVPKIRLVETAQCILHFCAWVSDRPSCLTFCCIKMSKNAEWINKSNLFFHLLRLRCSLTSLQQRYNTHPPKSKFFGHLISHLRSFPHLRMCLQPFVYGRSRAFSTIAKKWNRDIIFSPTLINKPYEPSENHRSIIYWIPDEINPGKNCLCLKNHWKKKPPTAWCGAASAMAHNSCSISFLASSLPVCFHQPSTVL